MFFQRHLMMQSDSMQKNIMKSMVLWYDIGKQGCTNESMKADPTLKDFSGNGHDATCYNFAWSGQSGIGKYNVDFTDNTKWVLYKGSRANFTIDNDNTIRITKIINAASFIETKIDVIIPSFKVEVTGIPENAKLSYLNDPSNTNNRIYINNGITTIPESTKVKYAGFKVHEFIGDCNITIKIIPEYPNALVSDGVNDCCLAEGLPILTDYTVIAKRKYFDDVIKCLTTKYDQSNGAGSFKMEVWGNPNFYSFGTMTNIDPSLVPNDGIVYMSKNSYNGNYIGSGNAKDGDRLTVCSLRTNGGQYAKVALSSFLLFNRTLTDEEIEWVKVNLIENVDNIEVE